MTHFHADNRLNSTRGRNLVPVCDVIVVTPPYVNTSEPCCYITFSQSHDGEWKDDKRHGQGTMKYADGDQYEG